MTYATEPAIGSASGVFWVNQAGAFVALDVTALVQGWIGNPASDNGVALSAGTAMVQFDSKENDLKLTRQRSMLSWWMRGLPVRKARSEHPGRKDSKGRLGLRGQLAAQGPAGSGGGSSALNYQGTYASTTNYALGAVVVLQGSSYLSLIASNHGNTPGLNPADWGLIAAAGANGTGGSGGSPTVAVSYQGVYASTANYALNDIVLYGASSYISLIAGNDGNTPALSPADWGLMAEGGTGIGPAGPAGPAGATGPQGPPGLGYQGAYASSSNYALSDVVEYQGSSYISLTNSNAGNTPPLSPLQWGLLASAQIGAAGPQGPSGFVYQGSYSSVTNYALGDVVVWQGASYTSLIASNHGNTPSFSPQQWGASDGAGAAGTDRRKRSGRAAGDTGVAGKRGASRGEGRSGKPGDCRTGWRAGNSWNYRRAGVKRADGAAGSCRAGWPFVSGGLLIRGELCAG